MIDYHHDVRELDLRDMKRSMAGRGPDQHGAYYTHTAALFHNRLCVIDRENGMQPMSAVHEGRGSSCTTASCTTPTRYEAS